MGHASARLGRALAASLALALLGCAAESEAPTESAAPPPLPDGYGQVFVLREPQELYSARDVTVSVNGARLGTLASGTYLSASLPAGAKTLTAALFLSRASRSFVLEPGKAVYITLGMEPAGLPPPSGALLTPAPGTAGPQDLFAIDFVDARTATAAMARLKRAQ